MSGMPAAPRGGWEFGGRMGNNASVHLSVPNKEPVVGSGFLWRRFRRGDIDDPARSKLAESQRHLVEHWTAVRKQLLGARMGLTSTKSLSRSRQTWTGR